MGAYQFFQNSFWGRVIYHLSKHKYLKYREEQPDYIVPEKYLSEKVRETNESSEGSDSDATDHILVEFDENDPENPYNWSLKSRVFFIFCVMFLTLSVYIGSAIYTPGVDAIMEEFGVSQTVATLPLSLFVVGYGTGTNILSPLSESARFGRTSIYIITLFFFFILQIPTALVDNIAGLCILRFLGGLFASAALATGGASVGDVIPLPWIPVGLVAWSVGAVCGPSLGPLIGAALVSRWNWRATFWFMCILSGTCFVFLGFMLPESYGPTILHRRAQRLRALTGNEKITTAGEIADNALTANEFIRDILWRPFEVMLFEPVVLVIDVYIALIYSVQYLWFEAFPLVFIYTYNFTLVQMGVTFIAIAVGIILGAIIYTPIIYHQFTKPTLRGEQVVPEVFLPMAIVGSILMPVGMFIFSWTVAKDIHWICCIIGAALFAVGAFIVFQTLFNYLSFSFYRYLASVFAGNNLLRSNIAAFFPIIGKFLFENLKTERFPIAWGSTILAIIASVMVLIPVLFYLNGPKLRARSKYAN